jgi:hypothetical protein
MLRPERQRIQIDAGILPDLVINKALKHKGKKPLQHTPAASGSRLMRGLFQKRVRHSLKPSRAILDMSCRESRAVNHAQ